MTDPGTRVNSVGIVANLGLAVAKFVIGTLAGSAALVADGFNSAGDVVATAIAYYGYKEAQKPPDEAHHYGHGKIDAVAGLAIAVILFATGVFISIEGILAVVRGAFEAPGGAAVIVAIATMVIKEVLYRYAQGVGAKLNSPSILASARDHRADVLAGAAVLIGVLGARSGFPVLDPLAAIGIGLVISLMAVGPVRDNVDTLLDAASPEIAEKIRFVARSDEEVREVDSIRVHPLGSYSMVDLEIYVNGALSLHEAHDVAHRVAQRVRDEIDHVRDVKIHVNPTGPRSP